MLILVSGKMCSGKDTLISNVEQLDKRINRLVRDTTRPIRNNEVDGVTYHFISDAEFRRKENDGAYISTQSFNTLDGIWKYATPLLNNTSDKDIFITTATFLDVERIIEKYSGTILWVHLEFSSINEKVDRLINRARNTNFEEVIRRLVYDECNQSIFDSFSMMKRRYGFNNDIDSRITGRISMELDCSMSPDDCTNTLIEAINEILVYKNQSN